MSRAPDHDPTPARPPTDWRRVAIALAGMVLALALIWIGLGAL